MFWFFSLDRSNENMECSTLNHFVVIYQWIKTRVAVTQLFLLLAHAHECMQKMSIYQWNAYLINISTPVSAMHLLIPFHDFFSLNTCLASNGSRGSVGAGGAGSGSASAIISLTSVSDPAFAVSSPSADDSLHPIIIFLSI